MTDTNSLSPWGLGEIFAVKDLQFSASLRRTSYTCGTATLSGTATVDKPGMSLAPLSSWQEEFPTTMNWSVTVTGVDGSIDITGGTHPDDVGVRVDGSGRMVWPSLYCGGSVGVGSLPDLHDGEFTADILLT